MKKIITLGLALTISFAMHAQRGQGHQRNPGDAAKAQTEKMKTELNLTDEQYASVRSINFEFAKKASTLRADSSISRDQRHNQLKTIRQEKNAELNKILTKEQQQKWADARKERDIKREAKRGDREGARKEHLKSTLSLSDDQSARMMDLRKSLHKKVRDVRSDNALTDSEKKTRLKALRDEHEASVKSLLSEDQYTKWKEQKASRKKGLEKKQHFQK
jgi:periplasmic protein CpxP/Spy